MNILKRLFNAWLYWMQRYWTYIERRNEELEFRWTLFSIVMISMLFFMALGLTTIPLMVILFYIAFIITAQDKDGND